ncbi:MAG: aminopeptidase [Phycisphaerales bacterium]
MPSNALDKLAQVIVRYSTGVGPGDLVTIVAEPACLDAVESIARQVLLAGGHPSFFPKSERLQRILLEAGSEHQWSHVCPFESFRLERCDVLIVLQHPLSTRAVEHADRLAQVQAARRGLMAMSMKRAAAGQMRYLLAEIPGDAAAEQAGMSPEDYARMVFDASFLDTSDPLSALRSEHERQQRLVDQLSAAKELRFRSQSGGPTDLTVHVEGGTWINASGQQNLPDGEVFTGPCGADGVVSFSVPANYRGISMEEVRLEFRAGRVINASSTTNQDALHRLLDMDPGARMIGEIALGTNRRLTRFTNNPFLDEKIAGTFHLALGAGYPESGNSNQSGLHWDLVHDLRTGGSVEADGRPIHWA